MMEFADIRPRPGQFVTLKEVRLCQELQDIRVVMNESSRGSLRRSREKDERFTAKCRGSFIMIICTGLVNLKLTSLRFLNRVLVFV